MKYMARTMMVCAVVALTAGINLHAAVLFDDSFDYGDTTTNIGDAGNWSSGSSVLKYDHDGGLTNDAMSGEAGGSMWLDYNASRGASNSDDFTSLDLTTLGEGDSVWLASLNQYVTGNSNHASAIPGGSVSNMGFFIAGSGSVSVTGTINQSVNASNSTGITLDSGDYLMLLRYTKGSGTSPVDSQIDLWINPDDGSSETALGTADWTLDSSDGQVKWGRDGDSLTSISATPSQQGRIDEIRIATNYDELQLTEIPEPSTLALVGLGLFGAFFRRPRRK